MSFSDFATFVNSQVSALEKAKFHYEDRLSPNFSVFDFIRTDEMGYSIILAWLLDPKETHAQGSLFLRSFVKVLQARWSDLECDHTQVKVEVDARQHGRIDILIKSGSRAILIENKILGAGDQENQLVRYYTYLQERGGDVTLSIPSAI